MQAISANWLSALQANVLNVVCYGVVYSGIGGAVLGQFDIVSGTVRVNTSSAVRRTLQQCELIPSPADVLGPPIPQSALDELFPDGNELAIYKGLSYEVDGVETTEVFPLGRFLMEDVEIWNGGTASLYIQLNGSDRGATIARAKLTSPYSTDGVSTLDVQLRAFLSSVVPGLTFNVVPSTFVPAQMTFNIGADPWASALALAASGGYELFPDTQGVIISRPVPSPSAGQSTMTYNDDETSIQTKIQRQLVNTAVPNVVLVTSQGSGVTTPLRSVWWDDDPTSPTFYNAAAPPLAAGAAIPANDGTYPTTVVTVSTSVATTQAQCDAIAQSTFAAAKGSFETLIINVIDNPAQEEDDVITVTSEAAGISARAYILDQITFALSNHTDTQMIGRVVLAA